MCRTLNMYVCDFAFMCLHWNRYVTVHRWSWSQSFCQLLCNGDNYTRLMVNAQGEMEQWKKWPSTRTICRLEGMFRILKSAVLFPGGNSKLRSTYGPSAQSEADCLVFERGLSIFGPHGAITILRPSPNWLNAKPGTNSWRTTYMFLQMSNPKSLFGKSEIFYVKNKLTYTVLSIDYVFDGVIHEA